MGTATNIVSGVSTLTVNSVDVGFTRGGVRVSYEMSPNEVKADQSVGTVKVFRTDETMTVATEMLESTLENMRVAMNQPSANLVGDTLTFGYDNSCTLNEYEITLVGVGPSCGTRTYTFYSCVAAGAVEIALQREEETVVPVEFICLKDPNNSDTFGTCVDT